MVENILAFIFSGIFIICFCALGTYLGIYIWLKDHPENKHE